MNNLNFLKKSELLNIIAQELAYVAPVSWKRIVYYTERLPDLEIGLRNASIGKCWIGVEEKLFDTSNGPALSISVELDDAIDELYKLSESMTDQWCGLGIIMTNDGKFTTNFYYDTTPLIHNIFGEYTQRLEILTKIR